MEQDSVVLSGIKRVKYWVEEGDFSQALMAVVKLVDKLSNLVDPSDDLWLTTELLSKNLADCLRRPGPPDVRGALGVILQIEDIWDRPDVPYTP